MRFSWRFYLLLILSGLGFTLLGCPGTKGNTVRFESKFGLILPGTPQISGVRPPSGPDIGGNTVIVEGSSFRNGVTVLFDGAPATNIVVLGFDQIQCVVPPGREGKVDVTVRNIDGSFFVLTDGYEYIHFEVIPNHGDPGGGTQVTVNGSNFFTGMQVYFGTNNPVSTAPADFQILGPNTIQCLTPISPTSPPGSEIVVDVVLVYPNGDTLTLPKAFSYTNWSFETPDNAATDINDMGVTPDGLFEIAVGNRGLVNIKVNTPPTPQDWKYSTLVIKDVVGSAMTDPLRITPSYGGARNANLEGIWIGDDGAGNYIAYIVGEQGIILKRTLAKSPTLTINDWTNGWVMARGPNNPAGDWQTLSSSGTPTPSMKKYNRDLYAVSSYDGTNVFACGRYSYVLKTTDGFSNYATGLTAFGSTSTGTSSYTSLYGCYADSGKDVFFVGSSGYVVHLDSTTNTFTNYKNNNGLDGTIGTSSWGSKYYPSFYDVAVVENIGGNGGTRKVYVVGSTSYPPNGTGYRSTIIEAVGGNGTVFTWQRMTGGDMDTVNRTLYSVYAGNDKDAYATGSSAMILKLDSSDKWNVMPYGTKYQSPATSATWTYNTIRGYKDIQNNNEIQQVWVAGSKGRIMHHSPPANLTGLSTANKPHMWFTEPIGTLGSDTIEDIHANAWNNVWAVGTGGKVFHGENVGTSNIISWNSSKTAGLPVGTNFYGVWTAGPGQVFACGDDGAGTGVIYFWDGSTWQTSGKFAFKATATGSTFRDIFGYGPQAVWACGDGGIVYKFDGTGWTQDGLNTQNQQMTTENLLGVYAAQSSSGYTTRVICVGTKGTIIVLDGGIWTAATSGVTTDLYAVHGASPYGMYAVGDAGVVIRFSSYGAWSQAPIPSGTTTTNFRSIMYNDVDDIIVGGENGTLIRYEGTPTTRWMTIRSPSASTVKSIYAVDSNETFLSDGSGTLYRGHTNWVVQVVRTLTIRNYLYALYVKNGANDDLWVVASDGSSARKRSGRWSRIETGNGRALYCMWANDSFDPNEIYTVGSGGKALKFDGTQWQSWTGGTTTTRTLFWLWGVQNSGGAANAIFSVGTSRTIQFWNGGAWANHTVGTGGSGSTYDWLTWVGGDPATQNDTWVTGDRTAAHYTGSTPWTASGSGSGFTPTRWTTMTWRNPTNGNLYSVGYSGQTAIYIKSTGQWKTYIGTTGATPSGTINTLWWVWGKDDNDVWGVGNRGTIIHWNGTAWSSFTSPTTNTLYGVDGDLTKNFIYACGRDGTLLKYDYANASAGWVQENISTDLDFWFVATRKGRVIVTSEFGTVLVK